MRPAGGPAAFSLFPTPLTEPVRGLPDPVRAAGPGQSGAGGFAVQPVFRLHPAHEFLLAGDEPVHHRRGPVADLRRAARHQLRAWRLLHVRRLHRLFRRPGMDRQFLAGRRGGGPRPCGHGGRHRARPLPVYLRQGAPDAAAPDLRRRADPLRCRQDHLGDRPVQRLLSGEHEGRGRSGASPPIPPTGCS